MSQRFDRRAQALLIAVPLAAAALGAAPASLASAQSDPGAAPRTHVVEIRQFKFSPAIVVAKPGDTIVWKNLDVAPHTATSKTWDSRRLDRGQSWRLKVGAKGTTDYHCAFHPAMKARVVVR